MKEMSIDLETYSDVNITKCGAYKYAESEEFEILLFGVSIDGGPVTVYDLACGDTIPEEILAALSDEDVTKWAFNASFERICLSNWLKRHYPEYFTGYSIPEDPAGQYLDPASWKCTMIWSAYMGLPLSLEGVGAVLKLQDQKLKEGKDLIRYFCSPCKPTKSNGGRTRNLPEHDSEKWSLFKSYNKRDVEVEMAIQKRLSKYPVPDFIWDEYHLDQEINDRGIALDMDVVKNAIAFDEKSKSELMLSMQNLTGLDNPNSVVQMKEWLSDNGIETESLGKKDVKNMIPETDGDIKEALTLRLQLAKSSVKKYQAMQNAVCKDGRAHGMFQFYGANRSGRFSGAPGTWDPAAPPPADGRDFEAAQCCRPSIASCGRRFLADRDFRMHAPGYPAAGRRSPDFARRGSHESPQPPEAARPRPYRLWRQWRWAPLRNP